MQRLLSLQFIIALFFGAISILLIAVGLLVRSPTPSGLNSQCINIVVGMVFLIFSSVMLVATVRHKP